MIKHQIKAKEHENLVENLKSANHIKEHLKMKFKDKLKLSP